jgi:Ase1/PRC1/MAP65 family protein
MDSADPPLSLPTLPFNSSVGLASPSPISRMDRLSVASSSKSPLNTVLRDHHQSLPEHPSFLTPLIPQQHPNDSNRMMFLSPSRTLSETLISLATTTGRHLAEIWDEVGYSPEERAAELSDLLEQLRASCAAKVASEEHFAATYRETIATAKEEVRRTAAALQVPVDPQLLLERPSTTQTLIDEHAVLEATLEGLRAKAASAKEDLQNCLNFLVQAHDALGIDLDPSYCDIESDLTTRRRELLHSKQEEMKDELATRTAAVVQLVRDCQQLMDDLRMDPSSSRNDGSSDLDRRILGSLIRSDDGTYSMISQFRSVTCVGISSKALEELTRRVAQLHTEKRRRKGLLQDMGAEIAVLWEKLHIPEEEQVAFTRSVKGLGMETITKGEKELKRLRIMKSEMLGNLIHEARATIQELWEETNIKQEDRRRFVAFYVRDENAYDDQLLEAHEDYIQTLQTRMEQMRPILRLIERREVVIQERFQYEDLQKDPERLTQRGAALTKQLMAEERMAIRIKRELPKLTERLTEVLNEWKEVHQEDFHYRGEVYTEVMRRQEDEWQQYKSDEAERKLKKKHDELHFAENRFAAVAQGKKRPGVPAGSVNPFTDSQNIMAKPTTAAVKPTSRPNLGEKQTSSNRL